MDEREDEEDGCLAAEAQDCTRCEACQSFVCEMKIPCFIRYTERTFMTVTHITEPQRGPVKMCFLLFV